MNKLFFQSSIICCLIVLPSVCMAQSRVLTLDEASQLVRAALPAATLSLPKFGLDKYVYPDYPDLYFFEADWDNPTGSVVWGHFAVDPKTGDVWDAIACREYKSHSLKTAQASMRTQIGLTKKEYHKIRRRGPMC
jgi:hypothetical protein